MNNKAKRTTQCVGNGHRGGSATSTDKKILSSASHQRNANKSKIGLVLTIRQNYWRAHIQCWQGCWEVGPLMHGWLEYELPQPCWASNFAPNCQYLFRNIYKL